MNMKWSIAFIPLFLSLAACGQENQNQPLPTLVEMAEVSSMPSSADSTATSLSVPTLPPTWTVTSIPTETQTVTITPSMTITDTETPTPTNTASGTPEPSSLLFLAQTAAVSSPLPQELRPVVPTITPTPQGTLISPLMTPTGTRSELLTPTTVTSCQFLPSAGFATIFNTDPALLTTLGCPVGTPPVVASLNNALQTFQNGRMLWLDDIIGHIYVLRADGTFVRFDDTFESSTDPESGGLTPPSGLIEPIRGFGKVWRDNQFVHDSLGWATAIEAGSVATVQDFVKGRMMYIPIQNEILILVYTNSGPTAGTWRAVPGQF